MWTTGNALVYRLASVDDVAQLADMRWDFTTDGSGRAGEVYKAFKQHCTTFLTRAIGSGQWAIWVAEAHSNEIVSNIYLQVVEKVPKPERLQNVFVYMTNVYTRPEWRGQGVGGRLLREACAWSRENDLDFVIVWPSEEAVAFYSRQGFQPVREAMDLHF